MNINNCVIKAIMSISIRPIQSADFAAIARIVNEAFQADAFFKKPGFKDRLDAEGSQLAEMLRPGHAVLVASRNDEPIGCIHVHWHSDTASPHGVFGMLSVGQKHARGGVGKALVAAAGLCIQVALNDAATTVKEALPSATYIEIPVINLRPELIPWYEHQGKILMCVISGI